MRASMVVKFGQRSGWLRRRVSGQVREVPKNRKIKRGFPYVRVNQADASEITDQTITLSTILVWKPHVAGLSKPLYISSNFYHVYLL